MKTETNIKINTRGIKINNIQIAGAFSLYYVEHDNANYITFYSKESRHEGGQLLRKYFEVRNDTDYITDYYENDSVNIKFGHELYFEILRVIKIKMVKGLERLKKSSLKNRFRTETNFEYYQNEINLINKILNLTETKQVEKINIIKNLVFIN